MGICEWYGGLGSGRAGRFVGLHGDYGAPPAVASPNIAKYCYGEACAPW